MNLKYIYCKVFTAISIAMFVTSLNVTSVQSMEAPSSCLFCFEHRPPLKLPFKSLDKVEEYAKTEGLFLPEAEGAGAASHTKDMDQEHVAKKQKLSGEMSVKKYQAETDVRSLIPVALNHFYVKPEHTKPEKVQRWKQITAAYPNVKQDILTVFQDFITLNPGNHARKVCCIDSVKALLNSSGAYRIMNFIEKGSWGEQVKFPESLEALSWLTSLDLIENSIYDDPETREYNTEVPSVIMRLSNLVELHLGLNEVSKLPQEIVGLTKLQKLESIDNPITELPKGFEKLTALRELALWGAELEVLPHEIGKLTNLAKLNLGNLKVLPTSFANLVNLRHLHWEPDSLSFLPTSFGKYLTKPEIKYVFQTFLPFAFVVFTDNDIKPNTIYLRPLMGCKPGEAICQYNVQTQKQKDNGGYYTKGYFTFQTSELITVDALEQAAFKILLERGMERYEDIRCDRFCGWEESTSAVTVCDLLEEDEDVNEPDDHGTTRFCGLDRETYKGMLADCYNRYHDHLLKRFLLSEFGDVMNLYIPTDITSNIADTIYAIEERDLLVKRICRMIEKAPMQKSTQ